MQGNERRRSHSTASEGDVAVLPLVPTHLGAAHTPPGFLKPLARSHRYARRGFRRRTTCSTRAESMKLARTHPKICNL